jgi:hypothetical protein
MKHMSRILTIAVTASLIAISATAGVQLQPNSKKYSQAGATPAGGRSGNAAVEARVLIGSDLVTEVQVSAGHADGSSALIDRSRALGTIEKIQFKSGSQTTNFNNLNQAGTFTFNVPGLVLDQNVQIQANVKGVDPKRTDVVTVKAAVALRPDLSVLSVLAPEKAKPGLPISISASVAELNGDTAANADCVLFVDGAEVDRQSGIWVAAGATVGCTFSHTFTTVGSHQLRVEVTNVAPADYSLNNNSADATIQIVNPALPFSSYTASASEVARTSFFHQTSPSMDILSSSDVFSNDASFLGYTGALDLLTATATIKIFSGSTLNEEHEFDLSTGTSSCFSYRADSAFSLDICRDASGGMQVQTTRQSGIVSFMTERWVKDFSTGEAPGYYPNGSTTSHGTPRHFGSTYEMILKLEDAQTTYKATPVIVLQTLVDSVQEIPWTCFGTTCFEFRMTTLYVGGSTSN